MDNIFIEKGYMGYLISNNKVQPFLEQLKQKVGENKFNLLTLKQQEIDNYKYHITILTHKEIKNLKNYIEIPVFKTEPELIGLGTVNEGIENQSYFIVVDWKEVNKYRNWLGLEDKDFHITIGFIIKDKNRLIK